MADSVRRVSRRKAHRFNSSGLVLRGKGLSRSSRFLYSCRLVARPSATEQVLKGRHNTATASNKALPLLPRSPRAASHVTACRLLTSFSVGSRPSFLVRIFFAFSSIDCKREGTRNPADRVSCGQQRTDVHKHTQGYLCCLLRARVSSPAHVATFPSMASTGREKQLPSSLAPR